MGWPIVAVIQPLHAAHERDRLLAADGWRVVYSVGVVFYVIERIPYHKAIWHGFVLVAAALHFSAIAFEFAG